ncbi:MAG: hypothetical protein MJ170_00200 [Alphaproteobacteria bacterium]|nr:hypothetical protein [Alphaproteobacteria bacterium]
MKKFLFVLIGLIVAGNALGIESKKIIQGAQNVGSTIGSGVGTAVGTVAGAGVVAAGVVAKGAGYVAVDATAPLWAPVAVVEKAIDDYVGTGCGIHAVSYTRTAAQGPKDNEFLYSVEAWEDINRGINLFSDRVYKDLRGEVWECDNQYCSDNTKQLMPAGHVFKGQTINKQKCYKCIAKAGFYDDRWEEVELSECGVTTEPKVCKSPWGENIPVGNMGNGSYSKEDCKNKSVKVTDEHGTSYKAICEDGQKLVCKAQACESDYKYDGSAGTCSKKDGNVTPDPVPVATCKASRSTSEGKACCDVPSSVAKWQSNKCVCNNGGEFVYSGVDTPYCKEKDGGTAPGVEPEKDGGTAPVVDPEIDSTQYENAEIDKVYEDIKVLESKYAKKASEWKDEEGKFNTARLASDSIAGVVLGTVGGVVTSTVIKKNQVEDGFEDLKCSIGGQSVATWGDEFQVGLQ